jgi:hypothetical protein
MGVKASSLMWCEYNGSSVLPRDDKPASYFYCYKVPPPSYNHNWTDLHYAASHGNIRRIHEIIHKTGKLHISAIIFSYEGLKGTLTFRNEYIFFFFRKGKHVLNTTLIMDFEHI